MPNDGHPCGGSAHTSSLCQPAQGMERRAGGVLHNPVMNPCLPQVPEFSGCGRCTTRRVVTSHYAMMFSMMFSYFLDLS